MAFSKQIMYTRDNLHELYEVIEPGDILEFPRGFYSHFGVYVGKYRGIRHCVVHLTVSDDMENYKLFKISASLKQLEKSSCKHELMQVGYLIEKALNETHGEIQIDSVEVVMQIGGKVCLNNKNDKKWNPCSDSAERAITKYENRHNEPPYHLRRGNCEHFVNDSRYNQHRSKQVEDVETVAAIGGAIVGTAAVIGAGYLLFKSLFEDDEKNKQRRY